MVKMNENINILFNIFFCLSIKAGETNLQTKYKIIGALKITPANRSIFIIKVIGSIGERKIKSIPFNGFVKNFNICTL